MNNNTNEEVWKDIEGYEGHYQVSDFGRVRSLDRVSSSGRKLKGKVLKQKITKGYNMVGLSKDGKQKNKTVSRLVAKAFTPNLENKPEVNHVDENKRNNRADNLEWVTSKENANHGTRKDRIGKYVRENPHLYEKGWKSLERFNKRRLDKKVAMIDAKTNEIIKVFDSRKEANLYLGLSPKSTGITDVISGRIKTSRGYKWKNLD